MVPSASLAQPEPVLGQHWLVEQVSLASYLLSGSLWPLKQLLLACYSRAQIKQASDVDFKGVFVPAGALLACGPDRAPGLPALLPARWSENISL